MSLSTESLEGKKMRVVVTGAEGIVGVGTTFSFRQQGYVVSADYQGGHIAKGVLAGVRDGGVVRFHYSQENTDGSVEIGRSKAFIRQVDGRLQLEEHFVWESKSGSGVNVFEEIEG